MDTKRQVRQEESRLMTPTRQLYSTPRVVFITLYQFQCIIRHSPRRRFPSTRTTTAPRAREMKKKPFGLARVDGRSPLYSNGTTPTFL